MLWLSTFVRSVYEVVTTTIELEKSNRWMDGWADYSREQPKPKLGKRKPGKKSLDQLTYGLVSQPSLGTGEFLVIGSRGELT